MIRNISQDVLAKVAEMDQVTLVKTFLSKPPTMHNFDGDDSHTHVAVIGVQSKALISAIEDHDPPENAVFWQLPLVDIALHEYVRLNHVLWYHPVFHTIFCLPFANFR